MRTHHEDIANPELVILKDQVNVLDLNNWYKDFLKYTNNVLDIDKSLKTLPYSERLSAKVIAQKFKGRLRYDKVNDQWYFWNGVIHKPCESDFIASRIVDLYIAQYEAAIKMIETAMDAKEATTADPTAMKKSHKMQIAKHAELAKAFTRNANAESLVRTLWNECNISSEYFADDRRWIVLENGVYDMDEVKATRQFVLKPHDPARNVYRMWNITEEVGAPRNHLEKFLSESVEDDGQARFLQKAFGTAIFGITSDTRSVVTLRGAPSSGKSMLARIMGALTDDESFIAEPQRSAIVDNAKNPEHGRNPMKKARIVIFSEITDKLNREFFLKYSGGDRCTSEDKYVKNTKWDPQGIMFFLSNYELGIDRNDAATFDRYKPVNFPHSYKAFPMPGTNERQGDPELENKILSQRSGLLEWLKEGYLLGLDEGFEPCESMEAIRRGERDVMDDIAVWLRDRIDAGFIIVSPNLPNSHYATKKVIYEDYAIWHKLSGSSKLIKRTEFGPRLAAHGFPEVQSGSMRIAGLLYDNAPLSV